MWTVPSLDSPSHLPINGLIRRARQGTTRHSRHAIENAKETTRDFWCFEPCLTVSGTNLPGIVSAIATITNVEIVNLHLTAD